MTGFFTLSGPLVTYYEAYQRRRILRLLNQCRLVCGNGLIVLLGFPIGVSQQRHVSGGRSRVEPKSLINRLNRFGRGSRINQDSRQQLIGFRFPGTQRDYPSSVLERRFILSLPQVNHGRIGERNAVVGIEGERLVGESRSASPGEYGEFSPSPAGLRDIRAGQKGVRCPKLRIDRNRFIKQRPGLTVEMTLTPVYQGPRFEVFYICVGL